MIGSPARQIWEAALGNLQLQVTRPSYVTWLKDTVGVAWVDGEFVVGTPNAFVSETLEQRMYSLITQALERVTKDRVPVRFQVVPRNGLPQAHQNPTSSGDSQAAGQQVLGEASYPQPDVKPSPPAHWVNPLNPRYTFDTFIVGKSNELTHAAAIAVSTNPGVVYNPLVMYSDVGLGKTHLLHAIGHRLRSNGLSLISVTTEEFTNQYVDAIRIGKTNDFRNRYRSADVLLLDDLQFLMGKEQTQEGFFHTFNALHMTNRQIVITSDRPVTSLTLLADRMRSRLGGGLVVDIQPPDLETRLAILREKASHMAQDIAPEILQFIAERIPTNIRELEGNLNRLAAYADLTSTAITLELAERAIPLPVYRGASPYRSAQAIMKTVADYFKLEVDALTGPRGKKEVSRARQIAMYLLREDAGLGPTSIGRSLGGRNHSTVIKNCAKFTQRIDAEPDLQRHVLNIRKALTPE